MNSKLLFIEGGKISLRPIQESDINQEYHRWLNDPKINQYSNRQAWPISEEELVEFIKTCKKKNDFLLAIVIKKSNLHIGNILLNSIDWIHRKAELSILVGSESARGRGFASEAWSLMTRHAFEKLNLHRLEAGTINPIMETILKSQGWVHEGTLREAFFYNNDYLDVNRFGLLKKDYCKLPEKYL